VDIKLSSVLKTDAALVRAAIHVLAETLRQADTNGNRALNLDLSGIRYMSRSFAHELWQLVNEMEIKGVTIEFQNVSPEIQPMLDIVKATSPSRRVVANPIAEEVPFEKVAEEFPFAESDAF
jgi:anti-anti-sigma regulatory factor